jgi:hypothetical protein
MNRILRFLHKSHWPRPLTLHFDPFGIAQSFKVLKNEAKLIFCSNSDSPYHRYVELLTLRLNDMQSRRLSVSVNAESATLRLNDMGSRRLTVSLVRGVDDSPYHRYREFSLKKFNSRLSASVMRGVADSAYQ